MSVTGQVSRGSGTPIRAGDVLTDSRWIELGGASKLVLKHTLSAREWTLVGPARALACAAGREEIILAQGTLRTEMGIGARPGAEVWVGTPYGSLRYADARAELSVTEQELKLTALGGELWLTAPRAEARERRVSGSTAFRAGKEQRLVAAAAVAHCARDATDSRELAASLLSAAAPALGERARAHVQARQRAHASCASATAAVLREERGSALEAKLSELDLYAEAWRGVPGGKS